MAIITLADFPLQDQLTEATEDGRISENARFNCVATWTAAACRWLTGVWHSGDRLKDAIYGEAWANKGTAERDYIGYVAQLYAPKSVTITRRAASSQAGLIDIIREELRLGHPTTITMPSSWNTPPADPLHPGSSHVGGAIEIDESDDGYMTVMNPWRGFRDRRLISVWRRLLCYNEVWPLSLSGGATSMSGVPSGWSDNGAALKAPNGVSVIKGFRDFVLKGPWDAEDWPLVPEYYPASVEPGNPAIGPGARQDFRKGSLGWTQSRNVYRIWVGQDIQAYAHLLADAQAQIAQLQASGDPAQIAMIKQQLADSQALAGQLQQQLAAAQPAVAALSAIRAALA